MTKLKRSFAVESFSYLVLVLFSVIIIIPLLWLFITAFKINEEIFLKPFALPDPWHFENFSKAWFQGHFNKYILNTILVTVPGVIISVILSVMCGYSLGQMNFPGRKGFETLFVMGLAIPIFSIIIPLWKILLMLKLVERLSGIILAQIGIGLPFGIMLMRSFFLDIDKTYADSARLDGCTESRILFSIMLPLAKPAMMSLVIFSFQEFWNAFLIPLLITHSESKRIINIGLMFFQTRNQTDYGLLTSGVLITVLPIIVVYIIFSKYFVEGIASGGLKG
jgi:ABC-type glycerol-3-phosphate transport system permease component